MALFFIETSYETHSGSPNQTSDSMKRKAIPGYREYSGPGDGDKKDSSMSLVHIYKQLQDRMESHRSWNPGAHNASDTSTITHSHSCAVSIVRSGAQRDKMAMREARDSCHSSTIKPDSWLRQVCALRAT